MIPWSGDIIGLNLSLNTLFCGYKSTSLHPWIQTGTRAVMSWLTCSLRFKCNRSLHAIAGNLYSWSFAVTRDKALSLVFILVCLDSWLINSWEKSQWFDWKASETDFSAWIGMKVINFLARWQISRLTSFSHRVALCWKKLFLSKITTLEMFLLKYRSFHWPPVLHDQWPKGNTYH